MRTFIPLCLVLILTSCSNQKNPAKSETISVDTILKAEKDSITEFEERVKFYEESWKIENYIVNKETVFMDSFPEMNIAEENCVVFKSPTKTEIQKLKMEYGEDDFYIIADDNLFYISEAIEFFDSVKLKRMDMFSYRFVMFINDKKDNIYFDLRAKYSTPWSMFFFSPENGVKIVDVTDIEKEYNDFFKVDNE